MATIDMFAEAAATLDDMAHYLEFSLAMTQEGSNYGWSSFAFDSAFGYNLKMFRITENETGAPLMDTLGPVLLIHGMFSEPMDWLARKDETIPSIAVQLS